MGLRKCTRKLTEWLYREYIGTTIGLIEGHTRSMAHVSTLRLDAF